MTDNYESILAFMAFLTEFLWEMICALLGIYFVAILLLAAGEKTCLLVRHYLARRPSDYGAAVGGKTVSGEADRENLKMERTVLAALALILVFITLIIWG